MNLNTKVSSLPQFGRNSEPFGGLGWTYRGPKMVPIEILTTHSYSIAVHTIRLSCTVLAKCTSPIDRRTDTVRSRSNRETPPPRGVSPKICLMSYRSVRPCFSAGLESIHCRRSLARSIPSPPPSLPATHCLDKIRIVLRCYATVDLKAKHFQVQYIIIVFAARRSDSF